MQTTADSPALIQTVHGTSFPFVGPARFSQPAMIETKEQLGESTNPDSPPASSSGQSNEV